MKESKLFIASVALGWLLNISAILLLQDWMGLEGYIEHCRRTWINIPWQLSAASVIATQIIIFLIWYGIRGKEKDTIHSIHFIAKKEDTEETDHGKG